MYMSPVYHTLLPEYRDEFGYMQNLHNGGVSTAIEAGYWWMLDNGVFTKMFVYDEWVKLLERYQDHAEKCVAIVIPDRVGDWKTTLNRFDNYGDVPKKYGYKTAFVTQDGMTVENVPWGEFDCLFVGGTDAHKLKQEAAVIINHARKLGVWVHIGRVNSAKRIRKFWFADSWDGTTLAREPSVGNQLRILRAAREARSMKIQGRLL